MRHQTTGLLFTLLAFATACSQGNYAQVEPDDLYFTHKDRKEANLNYTASASLGSTSSYDYNNADLVKYTNQHSPTITSATLASPTIQTSEPFYDATLNPDNISTQENDLADSASTDYYDANYAINQVLIDEEPTNSRPSYNYGANLFPANISVMYSFNFGVGSYYNPFYDPFYYPSYYSYGNYYPGYGAFYDPWRSSYYGYYPNYNAAVYCYYPVTVYNNGNSYYDNTTGSYLNGTKIISSPRRTRSTVSNYSGGQYVNRKSNRGTANNDSGIIVPDKKNGRSASSVPAEKRIDPFKNNGTNKSRRARYGDVNSSSPTIQSNRSNSRRKINTTVEKQRSRPYTRSSSSPAYRSGSSYNGNRSNSGYSSPSRSRSNNSYSRPNTRSSNSSRSRNSYSPSRSNSGRSSYSPSRSTPTRSNSRSSGSSSGSRSTTRKH